MATAKYVAEGFLKDSEKLLKDFVRENSTHFTIFAEKWKKANFVLIFWGREKHELLEFTHEIYQLTLDYLRNTSFILQVGAVYLLYALYRNQPSSPPVRVRITLQHWEVIKKLRVLAEQNLYIHLHYVINYLFKNAFDFVAYPILHGPCTSSRKMVIEKPSLHNYVLKDCKTDMSNFLHSNLLQEVRDLSEEYIELQAKVLPSGDKEINDGSDINEYINGLKELVHNPSCKKKIRSKAVDNRRAQIKANQFERKALFRQLNPSDSDTDDEPSSATKAVKDKDCIKRRGPTSRRTYLDEYELHLPDRSKMLKDLLSTETSSENNSEDEKDTSKDEKDN